MFKAIINNTGLIACCVYSKFFDVSGNSVSSAGDVNGDGLDDLIVESPPSFAKSMALVSVLPKMI
jgi:hypothetical protein